MEFPDLPPSGNLDRSQQWQSLIWMIATAGSHGESALRGLTIALTRLIQAEAFSALFYDARPHRNPLGDFDELLWDRDKQVVGKKRRDQLLVGTKDAGPIDLASTAVIAAIWEPWRLMRALGNLGPEDPWGPWQQSANHSAVYWAPWPLVWVYNGNHSSTAAMIKSGGSLVCDAHYDATPLISAIHTDGVRWYGEADRDLGPVNSLPMAGIIEIGRSLIQGQP